MDHQSFEQRIANLDARLERATRRITQTPNLRARFLPKFRRDVERLDARLQELDDIEQISFAAYEKTHPAAKAGVDEMNDAVWTASQRIFFANLPTVKDHNRQSKS